MIISTIYKGSALDYQWLSDKNSMCKMNYTLLSKSVKKGNTCTIWVLLVHTTNSLEPLETSGIGFEFQIITHILKHIDGFMLNKQWCQIAFLIVLTTFK